jgi:hypothetical protein
MTVANPSPGATLFICRQLVSGDFGGETFEKEKRSRSTVSLKRLSRRSPMERERWLRMYRAAVRSDNETSCCRFTPAAILGVYFWAVVHDRAVVWACRPENWPPGLWFGALPSQATMSRRLKSATVRELAARVEAEFDDGPTVAIAAIDAKPLPIGGHSKDRDAAWGRGVRARAKGYKFYAVWTERGQRPLAWRVAAMNVSEQRMAEEMIPQLPRGGWLLGDSLYDINKLYDAAARVDRQLIAPRKRPNGGWGHCRHSPYRLRGCTLLKTCGGRGLHDRRDAIERHFGALTAAGGGLGPLPAWVRRRDRVELWIRAKLIANAVRIQQLRENNTPANE